MKLNGEEVVEHTDTPKNGGGAFSVVASTTNFYCQKVEDILFSEESLGLSYFVWLLKTFDKSLDPLSPSNGSPRRVHFKRTAKEIANCSEMECKELLELIQSYQAKEHFKKSLEKHFLSLISNLATQRINKFKEERKASFKVVE